MITLSRTTPKKKTKLIGRGGTRGKTSGRGTKGQKARAGHRIRPHIRDVIKKLPKLRGRGKNSNKVFRTKPATVNINTIARVFEKGAIISPATLLAKGLIKRHKGVLPKVKILATGELTHAVAVYDCTYSPEAKKKIEAAGGTLHA